MIDRASFDTEMPSAPRPPVLAVVLMTKANELHAHYLGTGFRLTHTQALMLADLYDCVAIQARGEGNGKLQDAAEAAAREMRQQAA